MNSETAHWIIIALLIVVCLLLVLYPRYRP